MLFTPANFKVNACFSYFWKLFLNWHPFFIYIQYPSIFREIMHRNTFCSTVTPYRILADTPQKLHTKSILRTTKPLKGPLIRVLSLCETALFYTHFNVRNLAFITLHYITFTYVIISDMRGLMGFLMA